MKKPLIVSAFVVLFCSQAFAYVIVLKDGTRYNAKTKWTIVNGKAVVTLQSGQVMTLNPNEIDAAKSEEVNKLGLGNVNVLGQQQQAPQQSQKQQQSLGSLVKAGRQRQEKAPATPVAPSADPSSTAPAVPTAVPDQLDSRLRDTFERAYENVGIFEHKLTGTNRSVRVELTADSEDKVFNALSATSFLIMRNAGLDNTQIDLVEVFMKTTMGGSAGRFQMTRADADAISNKAISLPDYFVRHVIY